PRVNIRWKRAVRAIRNSSGFSIPYNTPGEIRESSAPPRATADSSARSAALSASRTRGRYTETKRILVRGSKRCSGESPGTYWPRTGLAIRFIRHHLPHGQGKRRTSLRKTQNLPLKRRFHPPGPRERSPCPALRISV